MRVTIGADLGGVPSLPRARYVWASFLSSLGVGGRAMRFSGRESPALQEGEREPVSSCSVRLSPTAETKGSFTSYCEN